MPLAIWPVAQTTAQYQRTGRYLPVGRRHLAEIRVGDARRPPEILGDLAGRLDLIVTSPPYTCDAGMIDKPAWLAGGRLCPAETLNYSSDRANLGHVDLGGLLDAMRTVLIGCARVLRPGGVVAMTVWPWWHDGQLVDLPGALVRVGEEAGLVLYERNVALFAGLRGDQLVPRASFFALEQVRKARSRGVPRLVTAHENYLVFVLTSSGSR